MFTIPFLSLCCLLLFASRSLSLFLTLCHCRMGDFEKTEDEETPIGYFPSYSTPIVNFPSYLKKK
jgi:hypothetical protein